MNHGLYNAFHLTWNWLRLTCSCLSTTVMPVSFLECIWLSSHWRMSVQKIGEKYSDVRNWLSFLPELVENFRLPGFSIGLHSHTSESVWQSVDIEVLMPEVKGQQFFDLARCYMTGLQFWRENECFSFDSPCQQAYVSRTVSFRCLAHGQKKVKGLKRSFFQLKNAWYLRCCQAYLVSWTIDLYCKRYSSSKWSSQKSQSVFATRFLRTVHGNFR